MSNSSAIRSRGRMVQLSIDDITDIDGVRGGVGHLGQLDTEAEEGRTRVVRLQR
jgi:hypothetical protein